MRSNFNHSHQTTINRDNDKINRNVVNKLITEITVDNMNKNQRKKRRDRWEGRKRLETLSNNTLGKKFFILYYKNILIINYDLFNF